MPSNISREGPTGVEGAGGPGCGARGRLRALAGLWDDAPSNISREGPTGVEVAGETGGPGCATHGRAKHACPIERRDGARNTRGATHRRQNSGGMPRKQGRQVDAPAARQLRGLGAARESVCQVHGIGLRRQGRQ